MSDDLNFTTALVLEELTELHTTNSKGRDNLQPQTFHETQNEIASTQRSIF